MLHPPGWPVVGVVYRPIGSSPGQNAIEASDTPLPGGLRLKRLITHVLCSLAYSDIAWYKPFPILIMNDLYCVFLPTKDHLVNWLISPSISKELRLKQLGWHFRSHIFRFTKHLHVSQWKCFLAYWSNISDKGSHWGPENMVTFHWRLFMIHLLPYQSDSYSKFTRAPFW